MVCRRDHFGGHRTRRSTVTPLQLAAAIGGIAAGASGYTPHLVKDAPHLPPPRRGDLNPENIQKVVYGMYGVVNEGGTGVRAQLPGIDVCGKTGTAQLASNELLERHASWAKP